MAQYNTIPALEPDFADDLGDGSGYRLVTAEILYQHDARPHLLESFTWQDFDLAPDFPQLQEFLKLFRLHVNGTVHSVRVNRGADSVPRPLGYIYAPSSTALQ